MNVANRLRKRVQTLHAGDMLPPEQELADEYSISYMTIRRVVEVLVQEGHVKRYQGRGTVVTNRLSTGEMAIVVRPGSLGHNGSPYYKQTSHLLAEEIQRRNPQWQVKFHVGKHVEDERDFASSLDLLEPGVRSRIRGVFSFNSLYGYESKLAAMNILFVSLAIAQSDAPSEYRVTFRYDTLLDQAMKHLAAVGCKKVGLIGNNPRFGHLDKDVFAEVTRKDVEQNGLVCKNEWIFPASDNASEQLGYEMFMKLWQQSERPDGIFVSDDILCGGILRASLQLGVKLPEELRLISQATSLTKFPFHLPVTKVMFDHVEQVTKAVDMMLRLVSGEIVSEKVILLPGILVKGQTT
ncbi:MAG: substrate-binding domain-containing protein [Sedimentisphaerales bacterium]